MERFPSAAALVAAKMPERPVLASRPHAAARAARWFLQNFPGDVAYAYKANSSVFMIGALYPGMTPAPLSSFMNAIREGVEKLPVREDVRLMCEPGRALVAEAESVIVRVEARRGNDLFINDGGYGVLFDAAHLNWVFPAQIVSRVPAKGEGMDDFALWGPTCDSIDYMKGPFRLPSATKEGDYIEIGNVGAYGRAIAGDFNGYGKYDEVILEDEPMLSLYGTGQISRAAGQR